MLQTIHYLCHMEIKKELATYALDSTLKLYYGKSYQTLRLPMQRQPHLSQTITNRFMHLTLIIKVLVS